MLVLIAIVISVGLLIYYLTGLPFEIGTGFTEMRNKARKGDFTVVDLEKKKEGDSETKLLK